MSRGARGKAKTLTEEMATLLAKTLVPDLTERARQPAVERSLRQRWEAERSASRSAADFADWVEHTVEQVGAAWILSCVFVRVLEDRGFLDRRRIAGEGAMDSLQQFIEIAPSLTERDYLLTVFRELATYPGAADVLGPAHNPAWRLSPSNDSIRALLGVLRETDGTPRQKFEGSDTRFLGDLYQDLSAGVRKRYALLQTPDFVERFILDQTLEPAIKEFGLTEVRVIDPTCGSGHFLLGAFHRLFEHRMRTAPGTDRREHAIAALEQVFGVDVNPYAVAIARFRLTLSYLAHAGIETLGRAPRIETHLLVADSLLHGHIGEQARLSSRAPDHSWGDTIFHLEDHDAAHEVLSSAYHVVVGNPPYIAVEDRAKRELYRSRFSSAFGKYTLSVPFVERFFQLASPDGFVGMINSNSFARRDYGHVLIETILPRLDLTAVIDTSGAHIPGHDTTLILFGRSRAPRLDVVRLVSGLRGESETPMDPAQGLVWSSIVQHWSAPGFRNDYIEVGDIARATLTQWPWPLGAEESATLKSRLDGAAQAILGNCVESIGPASFSGQDDVFCFEEIAPQVLGEDVIKPFVTGGNVRDWSFMKPGRALVPYSHNGELLQLDMYAGWARFLWPFRSCVESVLSFGGRTRGQNAEPWWSWYRWIPERYAALERLVFATTAAHNHFVRDRGGRVFSGKAPVLMLRDTSPITVGAMLSLLNSSTACFWMKQVSQPRERARRDASKIKMRPEKNRYDFASKPLKTFPVPGALCSRGAEHAVAMEELCAQIEGCADEWKQKSPEAIMATEDALEDATLRNRLQAAEAARDRVRNTMVRCQEEMDWVVYHAFGLVEGKLACALEGGARPEERPFLWSRDESPDEIVPELRNLWSSRRAMAKRSSSLTLLENATFKRAWEGQRGEFARKVRTFNEEVNDAAWGCIRNQMILILRGCPTENPARNLPCPRDSRRWVNANTVPYRSDRRGVGHRPGIHSGG
ncbi:MAG TPA: BREX-2 system adenine-specific DNA-methyltransferase PglX, partial [Polyangia bacterium]|nr:BREX-2 system adenine-specific DNA-methyltransferase PglX [Polyangia bacterium]